MLELNSGRIEDKQLQRRYCEDHVRLFILAHLIWLVGVSRSLNLQVGYEQRMVWLYALRDGLGDQATARIFSALSMTWSDMGAHKHQWVDVLETSCFDAVAQAGGPTLVAFAEVGVLRGEFEYPLPGDTGQAFARRTADLRYVFDLQMQRILARDGPFLIAESDPGFAMHHPLLTPVQPWNQLERFDTSHFALVLNNYFGLDADALMLAQLTRFRGRPLYFFQFVFPAILERMSLHKPASTEQLRAMLNEEFFNNCFARCTQHVGTKIFGGKFDRFVDRNKLTEAMFTTLMMAGGKRRITRSKELQELVAMSAVFAPEDTLWSLETDNLQREIDLKYEFVIWQALLEVGWERNRRYDDVRDGILSGLRWTEASERAKRDIRTKALFAWYFVRTQHFNPEQRLLSSVFAPFLPAGFEWPAKFADTTISISQYVSLNARQAFTSLLTEPNTDAWICSVLDGSAGADLALLHTTGGERGVFAIQCKVKQGIDFQTALWSVTPGCQYLSCEKKAIKRRFENANNGNNSAIGAIFVPPVTAATPTAIASTNAPILTAPTTPTTATNPTMEAATITTTTTHLDSSEELTEGGTAPTATTTVTAAATAVATAAATTVATTVATTNAPKKLITAKRAQFEALIRAQPDIQRRWLRGILSVQPFSAGLVERVNRANATVCQDQPVILLTNASKVLRLDFTQAGVIGEHPRKDLIFAPLCV